MQQEAVLDSHLLSHLNARHRDLKARIRQLERHLSLSSAEQVEYSQLKKLKLSIKDRIRQLAAN